MEKKTFLIDNKIVFYTGLIYFIIMALFVILKVISYFGLFSFSGAGYVYRLIVQVGLMAVLPICLFSILLKKNAKQTFEFFSFRKITFVSILVSILLGICVFIFITYISSLWSGILGLFGYQSSTSTAEGDYSVANFFLSIFLVGVLPGFCEEVAHRGLVLGGMRKNGAIRAMVLCGLLFGLMPFNISQFGYAFVVGIFFCFITLLTKSIYPAMIMHFVNNTISVCIEFAYGSTWMPSGILDFFNNILYGGNVILELLLNILLILLVGMLTTYLIVQLFIEGKKMQFKRFQKNFAKGIKENNLDENIDIKNKEQMMALYKQANMINLQQKLEQGTFTPQDLMQGMSTKKTAELMLSDNLNLPEKTKPMNYIFYYMAIFLGTLGTIFFMILNII